jgi:hypothetical protein
MNAHNRDWQFLMYQTIIQIKFFLPEFDNFLFYSRFWIGCASCLLHTTVNKRFNLMRP